MSSHSRARTGRAVSQTRIVERKTRRPLASLAKGLAAR